MRKIIEGAETSLRMLTESLSLTGYLIAIASAPASKNLEGLTREGFKSVVILADGLTGDQAFECKSWLWNSIRESDEGGSFFKKADNRIKERQPKRDFGGVAPSELLQPQWSVIVPWY